MEDLELNNTLLVHFDVQHLGTLARLLKASKPSTRSVKPSKKMMINGLDIEDFDYIDTVTKLRQANQEVPQNLVHYRSFNKIVDRKIIVRNKLPFKIDNIDSLGFDKIGSDLYEFTSKHLSVSLPHDKNLLKFRNHKVYKLKDKPVGAIDLNEHPEAASLLKRELNLLQHSNLKSNHTLQSTSPIVKFVINVADESMETTVVYNIAYGVYVNEKPPTNIVTRVSNYLYPLVQPYPFPSDIEQTSDVTDISTPVSAQLFYNAMSDTALELKQVPPFELPELETKLLNFQTRTVNWMLGKECSQYDPVSNRCSPKMIISDDLVNRLKKLLGKVKAATEQEQADVDREILDVLNRLCFGWTRVKFHGEIFWFNRYIANLIDREAMYKFVINYYNDEQSLKYLPGQSLLAEEMGLGKTVEVTALALLNPRPLNEIDEVIKIQLTAFGDAKQILQAKTTLIIAPDSILKQWVEEIVRMAPSLAVTIYKGLNKYPNLNNNARLIADYLKMFDIVFTTYSTISSELDYALYSSRNNNRRASNRKRTFSEFRESNEEEDQTHEDIVVPQETRDVFDPKALVKDYQSLFQLALNKLKPKIANMRTDESQEYTDYEKALQDEIELAIRHNKLPDIYHSVGYESPLMLLQFWRVVLDEVQMVSSKVSRPFQSSSLIPRYHAWAVSGTPIKKNLSDLHSVLEFLRYRPFTGKISKNSWEILTNININNSLDFVKLWKTIGLRHTKAMVHDDIKLPPQNRVLMTIPFNVVEQENYNQLLEQCLASICLDVHGAPAFDSWEPTPTIISHMRSWLVKLRQICCNPQVGQLNLNARRYRSKYHMYNNSNNNRIVRTLQALKTLENVLEDMLETTIDQISKYERQLLQTYIEIAQLFEFVLYPLLSRKYLSFASSCIQGVIIRTKFQLHKAKAARQKISKSTLSDTEDDDFEIEELKQFEIDLTENEKSEYERLTELIKSQNQRLRGLYLTLHKCYFLLASSYFQEYDEEYQQKIADNKRSEYEVFSNHPAMKLGDQQLFNNITKLLEGNVSMDAMITEESLSTEYVPLEPEEFSPEVAKLKFFEQKYYDLAEEIRQKLLKSSISNVSKAKESRITNREFFNDSKDEFVDNGSLLIPKTTKKFFRKLPLVDISEIVKQDKNMKLKLQIYVSKLNTFVNRLNQQTLLINDWMNELIKILCSPLLNLDQDPNGQEYEKTIEDQDKASCYLSVINKALTDRSNAIEGKEATTKIISNQKKKEQREFDSELERVNDKEFLQYLEFKRQEVNPSAKPSFNDLVRELKDLEMTIIEERNIGSSTANDELGSLDQIATNIRQLFENQKLVIILFQKELSTNCNFVFNARIDYFKQLQQISDSVRMSEDYSNTAMTFTHIIEQRFRSYIHDLEVIPGQVSKVITKFKYLQSLNKPESEKDGEESMCVICRTPITVGSLTPCGHKYCKECLEQWLASHNNCPICKSHITVSSIYNFTQYVPDLKANKLTDGASAMNTKNENLYSIYKHMDDIVVEDIQNITLKSSYSSKVDLIVKQVLYLKQQDPSVQIVVFSQWQDLLYILATAFRDSGISFLASHGTLTAEVGAGRPRSKFDSVEMFKDPSNNITCFLLNAKAQASGLTLINATHIFLCEPLVNTSLELQAISRIHRIGQTKVTTVWMFAIENTVEESIVLLSTNKRLEYIRDSDSKLRSLTPSASKKPSKDKDLTQAESITLTKSGGIDTMINRGQGEGETVSNDDLWDAFFCARASKEMSKTMNLESLSRIK